DVTQEAAASLGLVRPSSDSIAQVTEVSEGSPAAEAGVKQGDLILEYNGKPVPKSIDFPAIIADTPPGQKVTLKIFRDKKDLTMPVRIGELAEESESPLTAEAKDPELGIKVQRITPEAARRLGLSSTKGVLILEVQPGSPADSIGLEPADVIREVNQRPVNNGSDFERALRQARRGERILLLVQRGDNAVFFALKRKG
ncbi:MAG TPA: PDZ domain-containing protein, partial [Candidatus Binatia bacterium]|nr:PDZ domain-containing protein [Candidatus Binatia bacterium]